VLAEKYKINEQELFPYIDADDDYSHNNNDSGYTDAIVRRFGISKQEVRDAKNAVQPSETFTFCHDLAKK